MVRMVVAELACFEGLTFNVQRSMFGVQRSAAPGRSQNIALRQGPRIPVHSFWAPSYSPVLKAANPLNAER